MTASLERGLSVLAAFVERGGGRVDSLAQHLGMPVSTTYRYVRTLVSAGFLAETDSVYTAGDRLVRLARVGNKHDHLVRLAHPLLEHLATTTRETALLTVRVGTLALCLDRVETPRPLRLSMEVGALRPLRAGASAKVLLPYSPESVLAEVLREEYIPLTDRTPTAEALKRQLHRIRRDGYAVTHGELDPHAVGIAVPVVTSEGLVCALSVAGPSSRLNEAATKAALDRLVQAGRTLTALLDQVVFPTSPDTEKAFS